MDQAEASGKTVDDALKRALQKLGAKREDVEFDVLDEGKKGFLGRGARDAMVRVRRVAGGGGGGDDRPPDTRIPRGSERGARGGQRQRSPRGSGGQRQGQGQGQRQGQKRGSGSSRSGYEAPSPKLTEDDFLRPPSYASEAAGATGTPSTDHQGQGQARGQRPRQSAPRSERPPRPRREEEANVEPDINAEEVDFAAHITDDLLRLLDINAELTIREPLTPGDGKGMVKAVIDIGGEDLGLLIGRRGDTLLSLQYLVNLIVTRRYPGSGGVTIDVEHYRHRREEQVVSLANRMADRVRQTGSPITLEPMTAAERRLVHLALADDPELETNSIGEGDNRKVVISTRA